MNSFSLPIFTVVVPTYKDTQYLLGCLRCLLYQSIDPSMYEIRIVNNDTSVCFERLKTIILNSTLGSTVNVYVHNEKKRGSYAARNCGIRYSLGTMIAFTDSDCLPSKYWLENAYKYFLDHPESSFIAGKISFFFQKSLPNPYEYLDSSLKLNQESYSQRGLAATANLVVKKDIFSRIGFFDDTLLSGGDMDFTSRGSSKGFSIDYVPSVLIFHPARNDLEGILIKMLRVSRSKVVKYKMMNESKYDFLRFVPPRPKLRLPRNMHTAYKPGFFESMYIIFLINLRIYLSFLIRFLPFGN